MADVMSSFQAGSIGTRFHTFVRELAALDKPVRSRREWRVHSIFHRVVNLTAGGRLLSLVAPGLGNAPSFMVLELPVNTGFTSLQLREGMPVRVEREHLVAGDALIVDYSRTALWRGRSPAELSWRGNALSWWNVFTLRETIARWGAPGGAKEVLGGGEHPLAGAIDRLRRATVLPEEGTVEAAVRGLVGWGPGLTPSGDDLLAGWLAAAGVGEDYLPRIGRIHAAVKGRLVQTSSLSGFFLEQVMEGDCHEYLQEVIYATVRGHPFNVASAVRRLLAVGATSGTDMAVGVYLAFSWQLENFGRV